MNRSDVRLVRLADELHAAVGEAGRWLLLNMATGRYSAIPAQAGEALTWMASLDGTVVVDQFRERWPRVDLERLAKLDLVQIVPLEGTPPRRTLVVEFVVRNVRTRASLRRGPGSLLRATGACDGALPTRRPVLFDELEAAARRGLGIPGTSRQCTVVAISLMEMLRAHGFSARVQLYGTANQATAHASALVGGHVVDPADTRLELPLLVPLAVDPNTPCRSPAHDY